MARMATSICFLSLCLSAFWSVPVNADLSGPAHPAANMATAQPQSPPPTASAPPSASGSTHAQTAPPIDTVVTLNPLSKPADLVIRNRKIVTLRAEVAGVTPAMRVAEMQHRFANAISRSTLEEPIIRDFPPYGVMIMINDIPVTSIAYLDLDPLDGKPHAQVVAETVEALKQILAEIREERSASAMIKAFGYSLLATFATGLAIWLLLFLNRLFSRFLASRVETSGKKLTDVTHLDIRKVTAIARRASTVSLVVLNLFLLFTWLAFVLKQFPYTRPWGEGVWTYVIDTIRSMGLIIVAALPNLIKIALILLIARGVVKMVALLFEAVESGRITLPGIFPETARPSRRIAVVIIYVFALVACYPYLPGSDSDAFKGISVMLGLMLSLGGSGVINQAMSGLVLMYTRGHQVGDYVRIADTEGVVLSLDMLATKIRTSKREEVTIPNSVVLSTSTKNFTRLAGAEGAILHTTVTIGYNAPWRTVHQLLIEAAGRTAGLKKAPAAFVLQTALSDFYVEYQLNAFLEQPDTRLATLAELHRHIQDTFNEAGVAIVSPHYEADPPQPMPEPEKK